MNTLVLKDNPYHDEVGRFASKASSKSQSHWAEFGSPGHKDRFLSDPEKFEELYKADFDALRREGLRSTMTAKQFHSFTNGKVTLNEFVQTMLGRTVDLQNTFLRDRGSYFEFDATNVYGARGSMERQFKPDKTVDHHLWLINSDDRGLGAVSRFMKAAVPMYERMGFKKITTLANADAGSYAWAKYGFTAPRQESVSAVMSNASYRLRTALTGKLAGGGTLPKGADEELKVLDKVFSSTSVRSVQHLSDVKTPILDSFLKPTVIVDYDSANIKKVSMAKMLLNDNSWHGELDFSDNLSMSRHKRYVAGK